MSEIQRSELIAKLQAWQNEETDAKAIWEWSLAANAASAPADAAVRDVMDVLVALPQDMIVVEDAQVMIEALSNPPHELTESQNLIWNYFDFVDIDGRKQALADDPFYGAFCAPV